MDEWILVDNRALLRVEDISAITIEKTGRPGFLVLYKNVDGVALHTSDFDDLADAQHAIAEFMVSLSPEMQTTDNEDYTKSLKDYLAGQWTVNTMPASTYDTIKYYGVTNTNFNP